MPFFCITSDFVPLWGVGCGGPVELGGHLVGGVSVEVVPGAVVAAGGAGVGVAHGVLASCRGTPLPSSSVAKLCRRSIID